MPIEDYQYKVDDCDVPNARRKALSAYRDLRKKCLEKIRGTADNTVANQINHLGWQSAVFHTLNETRRIEDDRDVNGAMWNLIVDGYAHIAALGIRKLVDDDKRSNSIMRVLIDLEANKHLFTRERFVCYDGLPYDHEVAAARTFAARDPRTLGDPIWGEVSGPNSDFGSRLRHDSFDLIEDTSCSTGRSQPISAKVSVVLRKS